VDEAAEHVVTIDVMKRRGSGGDRAGGNFEIDATMWALSVVVADVLPKDTLKVAATENKHPVEAFVSHRPHPAFRVGIGSRRSNRCLDHPDAF
jgi:hypothetical protein